MAPQWNRIAAVWIRPVRTMNCLRRWLGVLCRNSGSFRWQSDYEVDAHRLILRQLDRIVSVV